MMHKQKRELTGFARILLYMVLPAVLLFTGVKYGMSSGLIPTPGFMQSKVIESKTELARNNDPVAASIADNVPHLDLPTRQVVSVNGPEIRFGRWFWNAHLSCDYANGGKLPTRGSLTAKYGVNLHMKWNDVTPELQNGLVAFATAYAAGDPNPTDGYHFVSIMGDQAAGFLGPINEQLRRLGADYVAEVVYSCGRSNGEDALMGPASWKSNPQNAIGGVVATVIREGDWNIVVKWARDNNIPVNPDEKTYDPDALNFLNAPEYVEAGKMYIEGRCEPLPVVKAGRKTGEIKEACVDAVASWTPVDVNVATEKGGLVRIVSTKEYSGQMPVTVIGIRKWNRENRVHVVNMIRAFGEAGDQVLAFEDARLRAAQASSDIYDNSQTPEWILKYYNGVQERDLQRTLVDLGGSRAHNLSDNLRWFGVNGNSNMFCATYNVFGNIVKELYPEMLPKYPECREILNTDYIEEAAKLSKVTTAETPTFTGGEVRDIVSSEKVYINFRSGSAELTPEAERELNRIKDNLLIANELAIELSGHTDNTGTMDGNQRLSEDRALAVKRWLQSQSTRDFPDRRFSRVVGYGQDRTIESNSTATGRAKNRRVEIVLGRQ
ncbi:MAG: OmpA family protein [Verrucomicrobiales bacterium]